MCVSSTITTSSVQLYQVGVGDISDALRGAPLWDVECDAKLRAQSWCTRLWQWWSGGWWCRVGGDAAISQMHFAASPSMSASSNASTDCVRAARHTLFWILGGILGQFFPHVKKHFTLDHPKCSGKNNGRQGKFVLRQIDWARLSALVRVPNGPVVLGTCSNFATRRVPSIVELQDTGTAHVWCWNFYSIICQNDLYQTFPADLITKCRVSLAKRVAY